MISLEELENIQELGLGVLAILGLIWVIKTLMKSHETRLEQTERRHREERDELRQEREVLYKDIKLGRKETSDALKELKEVIKLSNELHIKEMGYRDYSDRMRSQIIERSSEGEE